MNMDGVDVSPNAQKKLEAPLSINIDIIKSVDGLIIKSDEIIIKAETKTNSGIIIVGDAGATSVDKLVIVKVGSRVKDYKPGDVVIDTINPRAVKYLHKGDGEQERYAITNEYNISLATSEDNLV